MRRIDTQIPDTLRTGRVEDDVARLAQLHVVRERAQVEGGAAVERNPQP